jgi:hypothetical protein
MSEIPDTPAGGSVPPSRRARRRLAAGLSGVAVMALAGAGAAAALAAPGYGHHGRPTKAPPVEVTVFSPGDGDHSGSAGAGFVVDVALDAATAKDNHYLSPQAGYRPYFNDPNSSTFHPGPDPGAPGLVVLLSSTPDKPGTPFHGPRTNLAGLFQINGVARVMGDRAETWNTWQAGKPLFGTGPVTLTVYVVKGTAPAVVAARQGDRISNVVHVHFDISGATAPHAVHLAG